MNRYEFRIDGDTMTVHLGPHGEHTIPTGHAYVVNSQTTTNGEGFGESTITAMITLNGIVYDVEESGTVQQVSDLRLLLYAMEITGAVLVGRTTHFTMNWQGESNE